MWHHRYPATQQQQWQTWVWITYKEHASGLRIRIRLSTDSPLIPQERRPLLPSIHREAYCSLSRPSTSIYSGAWLLELSWAPFTVLVVQVFTLSLTFTSLLPNICFIWLTNDSKVIMKGNQASLYHFVSVLVFDDMSSGSHWLMCGSSTNGLNSLQWWHDVLISAQIRKTCRKTLVWTLKDVRFVPAGHIYWKSKLSPVRLIILPCQLSFKASGNLAWNSKNVCIITAECH